MDVPVLQFAQQLRDLEADVSLVDARQLEVDGAHKVREIPVLDTHGEQQSLYMSHKVREIPVLGTHGEQQSLYMSHKVREIPVLDTTW